MSTTALGAANGSSQADGNLLQNVQNMDPERLARGLGWFSLGLGLAEVLAPRGVAKVAGVSGDNAAFIRLMGLREIAHGLGIFSQGRRPTGAVWSRVVGDALDLAALGAAFASPRSNKGLVAFATANVLAVTALDVLCAQRLGAGEGGEQSEQPRGSNHVKKQIIIDAPAPELYRFWRDFENLPGFMRHLDTVRVTGERSSHWVAKGPGGTAVEWDAEITEERPDELIAWRSAEGAEVYNAGSVRFEKAVGGRGTVVRVELDYDPPGGLLGVAVAKLFGEEPAQQIDGDLRRFKQIFEAGEVVVSDGTLLGEGYSEQRAAQPMGVGLGGVQRQ